MTENNEIRTKQEQYVNTVRTLRILESNNQDAKHLSIVRRETRDKLLNEHRTLIESLERELGELTPTDIHESSLHKVTYFVQNHQKELY